MLSKKIISLSISLLLLFAATAPAQSFSVSTNLGRWAELGTMNVEGGYALSRNLSVHVGVAVNPWTFRNADADEHFEQVVLDASNPFQWKRESFAASIRWWPWHVFAGWWIRAKAKYMSYDIGGIQNKERVVGDAFGLGLGAGYSFLLGDEWNIDVGLAGWGGFRSKKIYESINSRAKPTGPYSGGFLWPEEIVLSITHIF